MQQGQNAIAQIADATKCNSDKMPGRCIMYCLIYWGSHKLWQNATATKCNGDKTQLHYVPFAFCLDTQVNEICVLSYYLFFVTIAFCRLCILSHLHYVIFAFCLNFILSPFHSHGLYFVAFAFCSHCILFFLHFDCSYWQWHLVCIRYYC